jgi:protein-L-isoaspartate(D-aspartate) O-methyltransferase
MGQSVVRIRRTEEGFEQDDLLPVRFVPLVAGTAEAENR